MIYVWSSTKSAFCVRSNPISGTDRSQNRMMGSSGSDFGAVEPRLEVGGEFAVKSHTLSRRRVLELEFRCVQEGSVEPEVRATLAVDGVTEERVIDRREMDADLMSATGLESALKA